MSPIAAGRALLDPRFIFAKAGLRLDMHYADLGAGSAGHLVLPAAILVGENGRVYAVDILKNVLEGVVGRARLEHITNLIPVWADVERFGVINIPSHSLGLVSLVNNIDLLKKGQGVLKNVKELLKTGGRFVVVDWNPSAASFGPKESDRMSADEAQKLIESLGFVIKEAFQAGPYHWGLVFVME